MRLSSTFRRTLQGVVLLGLSFSFAISGATPAKSILVFHVRWGGMDQTGLALGNPTDWVSDFECFLIPNNGKGALSSSHRLGRVPAPCTTFWPEAWRRGTVS